MVQILKAPLQTPYMGSAEETINRGIANQARQILEKLEQLGYHKLPKESVVLDKDLVEQIFAQICGIRMQNPTGYKSQLDNSYDGLKAILRPNPRASRY